MDEMTLMGFKLKKMLSCLMIINVIEFFFGGGLYSLFGFLYHVIGYIGAHKRNARMLGVYFFGSISMIIFTVIAVFFFTAAVPHDDGSMSMGSSVESSMESLPNAPPTPSHPTVQHLQYAYRRVMELSSSSSSSDAPSNTTSDEAGVSMLMVLLAILALILFLLVAFLKIRSLQLAYRMRKALLRAPALPVAMELQANQDERETAPLATPAPTENGAYPFMQPNYMFPYPHNMQGAPSVMPPPLMYGQQPVYYTYSPMQFPYPGQQIPQAQPANEKH